eukprot:TRINITY_DN28139_c0_g1_i2.p1 TRINITY_DN28139_c0_g1~~TRINITY_DN28139_c0_g1_i2.p1  ORF type:complete len:226 (+),score=51.81 TRINITY_DN28139_c0_g1_i2:130-807(+)
MPEADPWAVQRQQTKRIEVEEFWQNPPVAPGGPVSLGAVGLIPIRFDEAGTTPRVEVLPGKRAPTAGGFSGPPTREYLGSTAGSSRPPRSSHSERLGSGLGTPRLRTSSALDAASGIVAGSRAGTPRIGTPTALAAVADLNGTLRSGLQLGDAVAVLQSRGSDGFKSRGSGFRSTAVGSNAASSRGSRCSTPTGSLQLQIEEERRRRLETEAKILRIKQQLASAG